MKIIEIKVPELGESITEATIAKWLKKKGDSVEKDEVLLELETDKVSQEIYALERGLLAEIFFQEGQDVKIGETLAHIQCSKEKKVKVNEIQKKNTDNNEPIFEVIVPSLGESITDATIGKWMKSLGQKVIKGEPLVEIETDKVTQELYAENNGVLQEILFAEEEEVKIGEIIAKIKVTDLFNDAKKNNMKIENQIITEEKKKSNFIDNQLDPTSIKRSGIGNKISLLDLKEFSNDFNFSPAAKKIIREKNLDVNKINISNNSNRITKSDILDNNLENTSFKHINDIPSNDTKKPLSKLRKSIASRLKEAQNTAAMLTTFNEIDMSKIIEIRKNYHLIVNNSFYSIRCTSDTY